MTVFIKKMFSRKTVFNIDDNNKQQISMLEWFFYQINASLVKLQKEPHKSLRRSA